jgi:hypothetical protein
MNKDLWIIRKIQVKANRIASKQELTRVMSFIPNSKILSEGTQSIFELVIEPGLSYANVSFGKETITIEFRFKYGSNSSLKRTIIVTLAIIAYVQGIYEASIDSLYPLIISALMDSDGSSKIAEKNEDIKYEFLKELHNNNIALSEIALRERNTNRLRDEEIAKYSKILINVKKFYWNEESLFNKFCESAGLDYEMVMSLVDKNRVENNELK